MPKVLVAETTVIQSSWFLPHQWPKPSPIMTIDMTTYVSKPSAICQPTKPTQPFIPSGRQVSSKLQLDVC